MRSYWKIQTPYERALDAAALFGAVARYFWSKDDAQQRADDINRAHYDQKNFDLAGTFSIRERFVSGAAWDDADAQAVLGD